IEGLWLGFGALTREAIGSMIGAIMGSEFWIGDSIWTTGDFVVVDFDADPRVPLNLGRSFLKIGRALIDLFEGELTLRVGKEAITFNLDQTSRYSSNYNDMTANRIDVIDMACEEYSQEVLGFSDMIASGNPTPYYDSIVSTTSPTLTLFKNSDFLLEEVDAFLDLEDDPTSPKVDQSYELKIYEAKTDKSSIDEPPKVELKDLPPHLEYRFVEGDDKFPVIIAKYLSVEEKTILITVLKSRKRAIAWKLSDIKGINPEFCTHKVLMEEDFEPTVQNKRRVNPKIHDVIKNEVLKFLDVGLIYLISDSPWFTFKVIDTKGAENLAADHLSRLENPHQNVFDPKAINELFPLETLNLVSPCATPYHPQTSGQVEVLNLGLKQILERTVGENHASWLDKLDDALWAFRRTYKTPIGCTSYKLVYGKACHLPIELEHKAYWALKHAKFNLQTAGDHKKVQPNELNELCDQAYENSLIYK
nr:reverse transcriptase domain-containing protein [Tanacetum cinerariifolium]